MKGIQIALEGAEKEKETRTITVAANGQAAIRAVEQIANTGRATSEEGRAIGKSIRCLAERGRKVRLV